MKAVEVHIWDGPMGAFVEWAADTLKGASHVVARFVPGSLFLGATELGLQITATGPEREITPAATGRLRPGEALESETSPRSFPHYVPYGGRTALARQYLNEAIQRYRQPDGYEGDLV